MAPAASISSVEQRDAAIRTSNRSAFAGISSPIGVETGKECRRHSQGMEKMKTVTIQIGNSDDKLPQQMWATFVLRVREEIEANKANIHFEGGSRFDAAWQNACFVFNIRDDRIPNLKQRIIEIRETYQQDSVALTIGDTEFI